MDDKRFQAKLAELDYKTEVRNDTISRQEVNKLQKYRYNCGDAAITCVSLKSINELPPVTPQFSEDCVNRKAAIIQLSHNKIGDDDCDVIIQKDIETIKALPPVTPQQKVGRWINGDDKCPCCGKSKFEGLDADIWADWQPKFCPNCGARMGSEDKE